VVNSCFLILTFGHQFKTWLSFQKRPAFAIFYTAYPTSKVFAPKNIDTQIKNNFETVNSLSQA
jgi:hypothetical protein